MATRQKPFSHRHHAWLALGLWLLSAAALADTSNPLTGHYYGTATITQPASPGNLDLAFYLDVTNGVIQSQTSYVDLDRTMVFPAVAPKLEDKIVGPRVSGTLSPTGFTLATQTFEGTAGGRNVIRRVLLNNAKAANGGSVLSGSYVETVDGLTAKRLVIRGTFRLVKPAP